MSADKKWSRDLLAMIDCEGLKVVHVSKTGKGHIACCVSLGGFSGTYTAPRTPGCHRARYNMRADIRRLARTLAEQQRLHAIRNH